MATHPIDQCIILPFRATVRQPFGNIGLALHFLLGNVLALHPGLKEMWFGWRVKKIFPQKAALLKYCRDAGHQLDLAQISQSQQVRFWLCGSHTDTSANLDLFDAQLPDAGHPPVTLEIRLDDGLVGFRSQFLKWLASMALAMSAAQVQPALWPEKIDRQGLDAVGRALEEFYIHSAYGGDGSLDMAPFEKAVTAAPLSFMAHNLYGWARYRNQDYKAARTAFLTSLSINAAGVGAMAGLMWCGVYGKDLEETMYWCGCKAEACQQDVEAAREAGRQRFIKVNT